MKNIIKFVGILAIILLAYVAFTLNIDNFTTSYDEKIQEYENPYYMYKSGISVLDLIRTDSTRKRITDDDINAIKNSTIIKDILVKFQKIEEKEYEKYISKIANETENQFDYGYAYIEKVEDYNYGTVIYIYEESFELAFTLDFKNIVYKPSEIYEKYNEAYDEAVDKVYKEIDDQIKDTVMNKAKEDMQTIGVTDEFGFEPETIYTSYYREIEYGIEEDAYIIEDSKNNVKLQYKMEDNSLKSLQIGFKEYSIVL